MDIIMIIIGLLITAVDMEWLIAGVQINLLSDLAGYILILIGLKGMLEWSPCFKRSRKHALLSLLSYIGLRISLNLGAGQQAIGLFVGLGTIFFIYMTYYMMEGMIVKNKTEKVFEPNANLKGSWIAMAAAMFVYCFCNLADLKAIAEQYNLPGLENLVMMILSVAVFATEAFFCMVLNQNRMLLFPVQQEKEEQNEKAKN